MAEPNRFGLLRASLRSRFPCVSSPRLGSGACIAEGVVCRVALLDINSVTVLWGFWKRLSHARTSCRYLAHWCRWAVSVIAGSWIDLAKLRDHSVGTDATVRGTSYITESRTLLLAVAYQTPTHVTHHGSCSRPLASPDVFLGILPPDPSVLASLDRDSYDLDGEESASRSLLHLMSPVGPKPDP